MSSPVTCCVGRIGKGTKGRGGISQRSGMRADTIGVQFNPRWHDFTSAAAAGNQSAAA